MLHGLGDEPSSWVRQGVVQPLVGCDAGRQDSADESGSASGGQ